MNKPIKFFISFDIIDCVIDHPQMCVKFRVQCPITARQYGEVVLPDASTGQGPGTPSTRGQKIVTVQGGYGALFAVRVQVFLSITRVAVQV
jgi:hypothetical protein